MNSLTESDVEEAALGLLRELGWRTVLGSEIVPGAAAAERSDYRQVVLEQQLRDALARHNPNLPAEALGEAFRKLTRPEGTSTVERNRAFHAMLVEGIAVEYRPDLGKPIRGDQAKVLDFDSPTANDWQAVNQFTVTENKQTRRLDTVLFVNGLPLGVIELKSPTDSDSTSIWAAWQQIQTYKSELPSLFCMNELIVLSDGVTAHAGTLTAGREWFKPWRCDFGETSQGSTQIPRPELLVLLEGICAPEPFLQLIRNFIVFEDNLFAAPVNNHDLPEDDRGPLVKKMASYHQFYAAQAAVQETLRAAELSHAVTLDHGLREQKHKPGGEPGDRRIGVVWHTQGSGKSLTMAFFAGAVIREPAMANPTVVVLTDRSDLDDQLFGTFSRCRQILRQKPTQAASRADLRNKLSVVAGGVVFTTIQKFFPEEKGDRYPVLSQRRNIVVIADEAHRSQYDFIDGYARHMRDALPNASFVGFTGTPIELQDANTRAVFGDYISIYDIQRAVEDKATVPIYYEGRLAKLSLDEDERPSIDPEFEEVTEGEEIERKEQLKSKWAQLEALVGAEKRQKLVAQDIIDHFEARREAMDGKAMIVCMSRRICVDLHQALVRLRPSWHDPDDANGAIKVVMTGSASDPADWQPHIRNKQRREKLAQRFRDPNDSLRIVLVRDMWLTGFDAPSLHSMYLDKPMRGHGLMQAIARVNRVFGDKPGGLVVDYLGLAHELKQALATYTDSGGKGRTAIDQSEAVAVMQEKYEVCCGLFHGFDRSTWADGGPQERLALLPAAQEHILSQQDGKQRCLKAVSALSQAFALSIPHESALAMRDDVQFFQTVKSVLAKRAPSRALADEEVDYALRQLLSRAVISDEVEDIFKTAGLDKPDISILSEEFLDEITGMPQRNLAVDLLKKLLEGELSIRRRKNVVQARSFAELLDQALRRYQNRTIEASRVLAELVEIAKDLSEADVRGENLDLTETELAFYDALGSNDSAVQLMGDEKLRAIARELVEKVRNNVSIDWAIRENVRAGLRVMVKRVLRKHQYPPDKQEQATLTVLEQAEVLSEGWIAEQPETAA